MWPKLKKMIANSSNRRISTMWADATKVTNSKIDGFKEIDDATDTLFLKLATSFTFIDATTQTKIVTQSIRFKIRVLPNGAIPTQSFLEIANVGCSVIHDMSPEKRYHLLLRDIGPNECRVLSYLFRRIGGSIYICTIAAIRKLTKIILIIFIDDEYPGLVCWGNQANICLTRAGYSVGGKFTHIFYGR